MTAHTFRDATVQFLAALDPEATTWTFQTFDDDPDRKDKKLARVLIGTLDQHYDALVRLNHQGAGVFVTINETDGKGRKTENIVRVRAVFLDLDGAPLEPVLANGRLPHIVDESSLGKWHVYWLVYNLPLDQFTAVQKVLIKQFGGDKIVHDLPRVMRLPGFVHRKGEPFVSRIHSISDHAPYPGDEFERASPNDAAGATTYDEATARADIVAGQHYQGPTLYLLGRWARLGVPIDKAIADLCAIFDATPEHKRTGRWQAAYNDIERQAEAIWAKEAAKPNPLNEVIERFNARYMVVNAGGKALVYERKHDLVLKRDYYEAISFDDFRKLYLNERVVVGQRKNGELIYDPIGKLWLEHPDRRQYIGGIIFDPSRQHERPDRLNLWDGFAIEPKPGDWSLMQQHMHGIICTGNSGHFDYLMGWLARAVQFPGQQGEVAAVQRGKQGCGKGTLAKAVRHLFGQHGMAISNSQHLVGRFNAHLQDTVFLFADEAFYAGDKAHVGILKSLITEDTLTVEAKFGAVRQTPNCIHLMMASNDDWVVPASLDARRFFVLEVLPDKIGNFAYFAAIDAQMDNGGYQAMLHDLLHYDLTGFNVRRVPHTEGLNQQRKQSLAVHHAWWQDVLHRGYVHTSKLGLEHEFQQWHDVLATDLLFDAYSEYAKRRNDRHPLSRETFGRFLVDMGCQHKRPTNVVAGEAMLYDEENLVRRPQVVRKLQRTYAYSLGTLDKARDGFVKATGLAIVWPDVPDVPDLEDEAEHSR